MVGAVVANELVGIPLCPAAFVNLDDYIFRLADMLACRVCTADNVVCPSLVLVIVCSVGNSVPVAVTADVSAVEFYGL